jgi:hypothetical protein
MKETQSNLSGQERQWQVANWEAVTLPNSQAYQLARCPLIVNQIQITVVVDRARLHALYGTRM